MLIALVLILGVVSAEGGWGEFADDDSGGDSIEEDLGVEDEVVSDVVDGTYDLSPGEDSEIGETSSGSGDSTEHTQNFYLALGVGMGALFIFLLLLFLLLKRPRNRWKKRK